jgi:adenylosuccinate synthase
MSVSIIFGGQFGDEGKGKASHYFAKKFNAAAAVRVGGSNSSHTVIGENGKEYRFHILPTAAIEPSMICVLPSGSYIDINMLNTEIEFSGISTENLKIDPFAVIIEKSMIDSEHQSNLYEQIGSTLSGTGAAVIKRLSRVDGIKFAKECPELKPYITDTKGLLRTLLDEEKHILIEGTQGFGLSPINSSYYPYCTSRDTTAAGFLMETGLSPFDVENVIMIIRAWPIRVSGNSGPLPNETNWLNVAKLARTNEDLAEYVSGTKRMHRIAEFSADVVKRAIQVNRPNIIAMNHVDHIDYSCHNSKNISNVINSFVDKVMSEIGQNIDYIGTGKAILLPTNEVYP